MQLKILFKDAELLRAEAKQALASAGETDAKAASAFDVESSDLEADMDARSRAVAALEKGAAGSSLLESGVVSSIRKLAMNAYRVSNEGRSTLLSFLFGGYAPQSGDIIGILKQLKDEMSADLANAQKAKQERKTNHSTLVATKGEEIASLTVGVTEQFLPTMLIPMTKLCVVLSVRAGVAAVKVNLLSQVIGLLKDLHTEVTADASAELEAFKTYAQWCNEQAQDDGHPHRNVRSVF